MNGARPTRRRRRRLPGDGGFVYAIGPPRAPDSLIKLGRTCDREGVAGRLGSLQSQSPLSLSCFAAIACVDKADLAATEVALHSLFRDERRHGEWFAQSPRLEAAITKMWRTYGRIVSPACLPESIPLLRDAEDARVSAAQHWDEVVGRWWRRHFPTAAMPEMPEPPLLPEGFYDDRGASWNGTGIDFVHSLLLAVVATA